MCVCVFNLLCMHIWGSAWGPDLPSSSTSTLKLLAARTTVATDLVKLTSCALGGCLCEKPECVWKVSVVLAVRPPCLNQEVKCAPATVPPTLMFKSRTRLLRGRRCGRRFNHTAVVVVVVIVGD